MKSTWREENVDEGNVYCIADTYEDITIKSQYAFTTVYSGSQYVYTISRNETLNTSKVIPILEINYFLHQEGFSPNQWIFTHEYVP